MGQCRFGAMPFDWTSNLLNVVKSKVMLFQHFNAVVEAQNQALRRQIQVRLFTVLDVFTIP